TRMLPKPMMPLLGRTLLEVAIDTAKRLDPDLVVVNAHHLAQKLENYIHNHDFGVRVEVSREKDILGTAGGIKAAQKWLAGDDFAVINSDIIADVDWEGMLRAHRERGALATLMLRTSPHAEEYGALYMDKAGQITRFLDSVGPGHLANQEPLMFTGISILSGAMLERIPDGRGVDISGEIYRPMTAKGEALFGFVSGGDWVDVGTTAHYHKMVMEMLEANPRMVETEGKEYTDVTFHPPVYIDPKARISAGCILGPHVAIHAEATLGAGVHLKNCVVLPGQSVRSGAALEDMVV
ncbi:MAG: NDP-sugar synthase, partial [Nitrospinota bacterium]|nr:NDP-sugar synthase [Nitrospinota bacterium]